MVLFGLEVPPIEANRQALRAAADLDLRLDALHMQLLRDLGCATEHVIHLHTGMAAVGETGDHQTRTLTAAGSVIDVVRQLAEIEKNGATARDGGHSAGRIVVSRTVCVAAQRNMQDLAWCELTLPDSGRISVARLDSASMASRPRR